MYPLQNLQNCLDTYSLLHASELFKPFEMGKKKKKRVEVQLSQNCMFISL